MRQSLISLKAGWLVLVLSLFTGATGVSATGRIDLLQAYDLAISSDPTFAVAEVRTLIGKREYRDAIYGYFPRASGQLDLTRKRQNIIESQNSVLDVGEDAFPIFEGAVTLNQPLIDYERFARIKTGGAIRDRLFAEFAASRQDLMVRLSEAYFKALSRQKRVTLVQAAVRQSKAELRSAQGRSRAGQISRSELKDVEAQARLSEAELIDAETNFQDALEELRTIIGTLPRGIAGLAGPVRVRGPLPRDMNTWVNRALAENQTLRAQQFKIAQARAEREQKRGDVLPDLELVGEYDYTDQGGSQFGGGSRTENVSGTLRLNVPIFNAEGTGYEVHKYSHLVLVEKLTLDKERRSVARETRNLYRILARGSRKVAALNGAVDARRIARDEFVEKQSGGQATSVDVLKAQRNLLRAQRDLFDAELEYLLNSIKLKAAVGNLSEQDLIAANNLLSGTYRSRGRKSRWKGPVLTGWEASVVHTRR